MEIKIPKLSLVLLIGTSGSGKSTFAHRHFAPYEIVSSDRCRGIVSNDENSLSATSDAFDLVHYIIGKRLNNRLLTVVDATNVQAKDRQKLINLAREYHTLPVAIVLDLPEEICQTRNQTRPDRDFGKHVIRRQKQQLKRSLKGLKRQGFRRIHILKSVEEVNSVTNIVREKLYNDKTDIKGAFDIIGDIHGCYDETIELMKKLGYIIETVDDNGENYGIHVSHPQGRQIIFVGDLVDRGPKSPQVLKLVMSMTHNNTAYCVVGNHEHKLQKKLKGKKVKLSHGLAETMEQLGEETPEFIDRVKEFLYSLISHYVFDDGKLVVAHAGIKEQMQGRGSSAVRSFCMYGETTGEIDEYGLPVRYDWAQEYRGKAKVVYGHVPVIEAEWFNNTIDIDTGCVFGGKLTALRYPEDELVSVPAKQTYYEPIRPLGDNQNNLNELTQQQEYDDLLNIDDVIGKRVIHTKLRQNIGIQEENSIAALEMMSRFAINPKWLIYLPPTMSPSATSELPEFLEHPLEAINYYRTRGINKILCEEKHMGSRVILVICKDEATVLQRFGVSNRSIGVCYTRSGRNFFNDRDLEQQFLEKVLGSIAFSHFH